MGLFRVGPCFFFQDLHRMGHARRISMSSVFAEEFKYTLDQKSRISPSPIMLSAAPHSASFYNSRNFSTHTLQLLWIHRLPCAVVHCTALHCTAHCTAHCTEMHYTSLHCTALHRTALHCTALSCTALHCTALHCTALHCTALYCTSLHFTPLHCSAVQ